MKTNRRTLFLIYEGFELLDLSGPASVFSAANSLMEQTLYEVKTLSSQGGEIQSNAGLRIASESLSDVTLSKSDTILVTGAGRQSISNALTDTIMADWLARVALEAERYGSICSGAFLAANAGLLDGRKVTTHWAGRKTLAKTYPSASVESDALYVVDEGLWTSAGVTTGIDMALAMVERDHGATLMRQIARWLVIYAHRPGNQSQFSSLLEAQSAGDGIFADLITWIGKNLDRPLRLEELADRVTMSERTFRRKFTAQVGVSPSKFLEDMRLDRAKKLLSAKLPINVVASKVGFRSEAGFRTAFQRSFGITPSMHAIIHFNHDP
ncbi:MAG: GlxA family transcriptional regulator [Parasphingorhabdus sp.]